LSTDQRTSGQYSSARDVLEIIDELASARLNIRDLVFAVTTALSKQRSGTWVTALMAKDPNMQLVVSADSQNPAMADYVDEVVAALDSPGRAPISGVSQQVIESGIRIFWRDLPYDEFLSRNPPAEQAYLRSQPPPRDPEPLDVLIVPMRSRGSTIGSLGLFVRDVHNPLTEEYAQWVQVVADRLGIAAENAQLYEDAIVRLNRLSSLQNISGAISANMDLQFTLKVILEQVLNQLKVDAADILLLDERDDTLASAASKGFVATAVSDLRLPVDEGLPGRALTTKHIETVTAPSQFFQFKRRSLFAREGFKSYVAAPLTARGKLVGVIELFDRSVLSPDQEWLSFLDSLASIAAIAIDLARVNELLKAGNANHPLPKSRSKLPELSKVEWDMLKLLVEGHTNREISAHVHLSQNTIKFHVRQMLQKTGTTNRTDLTRQAIQEGWV
jgi:GAF domain-containing protein/DNA-binding CsgD family transcriptional regulator